VAAASTGHRAVNGPAVTGGLELVLHCDFTLASERAAFADTTPGSACCRMGTVRAAAAAVGCAGPADELYRQLRHGEVALQWGLVNQVSRTPNCSP